MKEKLELAWSLHPRSTHILQTLAAFEKHVTSFKTCTARHQEKTTVQ